MDIGWVRTSICSFKGLITLQLQNAFEIAKQFTRAKHWIELQMERINGFYASALPQHYFAMQNPLCEVIAVQFPVRPQNYLSIPDATPILPGLSAADCELRATSDDSRACIATSPLPLPSLVCLKLDHCN
ncbi:unnamed protein product, partial [Polarella glacialis]